MTNIQESLQAFQPYVIGIRYFKGMPLLDVIFKDGWSILEDPSIKLAGNEEQPNYYMVYSESENATFDNLLVYVDKIIKLNEEREKKLELLKARVNDLKEIFKKTSLNKLNRLKFTFSEDELVPDLNDFDIEDDLLETPSPVKNNTITQTELPIEEEVITGNPLVLNAPYLDAEGNPIAMTEEEREMIEEEARAERNRKILADKKPKQNNKAVNKLVTKPLRHQIELPPKPNNTLGVTSCNCGPDEACDICIDSKDY